MKPETPKHSRMTILLSVNAAAIVIAGVLISSAIWLNGGLTFRAVDERSDIVDGTAESTALLESVSSSKAKAAEYVDIIGNDDYISTSSHEYDGSAVSAGELWNENAIVIYGTPDVDICVGDRKSVV